MNIAIWILSGLLAFAFAGAGFFKLSTDKEGLKKKGMGWVDGFSATQVKLIGLAEVLGAIGLIVPHATGILPMLSHFAAAALAVLMVGAVVTHVRRKESFVPALVLCILSVVLAALTFPFHFGGSA